MTEYTKLSENPRPGRLAVLFAAVSLLFLWACRSPGDFSGSPMDRLPGSLYGWTQDKEASFDRSNIFDYMNGAGKIYLAYDYRNLSVRRYANPRSSPILIEVYDMGRPEEAYGICSLDRDGEEAAFGEEAYYAPGLLRFRKGRYFIRILAEEETKRSRKAVFKLGRVLDASLEKGDGVPGILGALPTEGLQPASPRYFHSQVILDNQLYLGPENILNLNPQTELLLAEYRWRGQCIKILIAAYPGEAPAAEAAENFARARLGKSPDGGFAWIRDEGGRITSMRREDRFIIMSFEGMDKSLIESLTTQVAINLRGISGR